jgi:hypothetical protein
MNTRDTLLPWCPIRTTFSRLVDLGEIQRTAEPGSNATPNEFGEETVNSIHLLLEEGNAWGKVWLERF